MRKYCIRILWLISIVSTLLISFFSTNGISQSVENKNPFNFGQSDCFNIEIKRPDFFPLSLLHTSPIDNFPYWFLIEGANNCSQKYYIEVTFSVRGVAELVREDLIKYTIEKNKPFFSYNVPFPIKLKKNNINKVEDSDEVTVGLIVRKSDNKEIIFQRTYRIIIRDKKEYCWNLKKHDGSSVSQEFLLASLTAWSQAADKKLKEKAEAFLDNVRKYIPLKRRSDKWIESCYSLMDRAERVEIVAHRPFPPKYCAEISPPAKVLKESIADSLEASLLVGALAHKADAYSTLKLRLVLFIIFNSKGTSPKYILGWYTLGNNLSTLRAIDIGKANSLVFDKNKKLTTKYMKGVLKSPNTVASDLKENGVFIDNLRNLYAVDLYRAAKRYRIRGMP